MSELELSAIILAGVIANSTEPHSDLEENIDLAIRYTLALKRKFTAGVHLEKYKESTTADPFVRSTISSPDDPERDMM